MLKQSRLFCHPELVSGSEDSETILKRVQD